MFPQAEKQWGPGFLEARTLDAEGFPIFTPLEMNTDAWSAALGGGKGLGTQVVFFPPEDQFYFFDYRAAGVGAFCPVSEQKLQLLLSNYLMRCAEECDRSVDVQPLFSTFRKPDALKAITDKAKILLEADRGFFSGKNGKRRIVDGKIIEPNAAPTYVEFVKRAIVPNPEGKLLVSDAFFSYYQFCKDIGEPPLTRADFKELVAQVIRQEYRLGLRHDIRDERGKANHGWVGLDLQISGRN